MKINNNFVKPGATEALRGKDIEKNPKTDGPAASSVDSARASGAAKVAVSSEAQAFQKAKAIASKDTVDEAKVARLQKLIDEGKYKVDSKAVADRLVDEHLLAVE
jgi:negative regulator of flagellin synthesis FlgM